MFFVPVVVSKVHRRVVRRNLNFGEAMKLGQPLHRMTPASLQAVEGDMAGGKSLAMIRPQTEVSTTTVSIKAPPKSDTPVGLKSYRLLTAQMRVLPDFIIIGAQKAGTTSLYNYLTKHPCIAPALEKELHFFDYGFNKSLNTYRAYFPSLIYGYYVRRWYGHFITGEASPYYIFHPLAAKRMANTIPHVKLIALLRNPVDRAYSHYWHEVESGWENLSFEEALKSEGKRLQGEHERIVQNETYYSYNHQHFSYLSRGIYVDQLKVWREFFPKEQMLILKSEAFYASPGKWLKEALSFLGVPEWEPERYHKFLSGDYPVMDSQIRKSLIEYYRPHNERLYEFLDKKFDWDE